MNTNEILFVKAKSYGYRSWFSEKHSSLPNTNYSLKAEKMLTAFDDAIIEANKIDCIWFDGEKSMPALFKVCPQNILEGLCRLKNFKELIPAYFSKYFLIVEDKEYQIALSELSKPTFSGSQISIIKKSELQSINLN